MIIFSDLSCEDCEVLADIFAENIMNGRHKFKLNHYKMVVTPLLREVEDIKCKFGDFNSNKINIFWKRGDLLELYTLKKNP